MRSFHSNIISIHGEKGKTWLQDLPDLVAQKASEFYLSDLKPFSNLTHNYLLSGFQGDTTIILKLTLDDEALKQEAFALKCFEDYGAVKVLVEKNGMLLLERAMPGTSLKNYFPNKEQESINIACKLMKRLHQASIPKTHNFPHIRDWLLALDKDWDIPHEYLEKARILARELLKTAAPDVLLHGDLHHDNILQNDETWVVIDPKGVIGEPAYEAAAFIRNPMLELLTHDDAPSIFHNRMTCFAEAFELPERRIFDWCFVQAVLCWIWALDDGCDTSYWQKLVKIFP